MKNLLQVKLRAGEGGQAHGLCFAIELPDGTQAIVVRGNVIFVTARDVLPEGWQYRALMSRTRTYEGGR